MLVHRHTPLLVPVSKVPTHSDRVYQVYADVLPINDSLFYSVVQGETGGEATMELESDRRYAIGSHSPAQAGWATRPFDSAGLSRSPALKE